MAQMEILSRDAPFYSWFILYCGLRVKEVAEIKVNEVEGQYLELHTHKMYYQTRAPKVVHIIVQGTPRRTHPRGWRNYAGCRTS